MQLVRLYEDDRGESHFEELEVALAPKVFAPPAPAVEVSDPYEARRAVFLRIPVDWLGEWHPSPKRQIWLGLRGALRVTTSDGETRTIPAGTAWLMEDKTGKGHASVSIGGEPAVGAVIELE